MGTRKLLALSYGLLDRVTTTENIDLSQTHIKEDSIVLYYYCG